MKQILCNVYDVVSQTWGSSIYSFINQAAALRAFSHVVNDPHTSWYKNPSDYIIYVIGDLDLQTGNISLLEEKLQIARPIDLINTEITNALKNISQE